MSQRIIFTFTDTAYAETCRLQEQTSAADLAAVVQQALTWYRWALKRQAQGYQLVAEREEAREAVTVR